MANLETQKLDSIIASRRALLAVGGAALAGLAFAPKANAQTAITDNDILNFALNLEYLEAQFYNLAVYGLTIDKLPKPISTTPNGGTAGTVTLKPVFTPVPFLVPTIQAYATETAGEEAKHVVFLQGALGKLAVAMPNIDLYNSFNALANLAGIAPSFDPFASDANFLIGAYIFEDVGVSAYHGAAGLISDKKGILPAAIGIHAVEAYHAGLVRTSIYAMDATSTSPGTLTGYTQKISALRSKLANGTSKTVDDFGIMTVNVPLNTSTSASTTGTTSYPAITVVDADITASSIAVGRTTTQVISIVTGGNVKSDNTGGFFPNALNGTIGAQIVKTGS